MNTEPTYTLKPSFTLMELVAMRVSLKTYICDIWKWRHDATWRKTIRECIAAYRKTERMEVTI